MTSYLFTENELDKFLNELKKTNAFNVARKEKVKGELVIHLESDLGKFPLDSHLTITIRPEKIEDKYELGLDLLEEPYFGLNISKFKKRQRMKIFRWESLFIFLFVLVAALLAISVYAKITLLSVLILPLGVVIIFALFLLRYKIRADLPAQLRHAYKMAKS